MVSQVFYFLLLSTSAFAFFWDTSSDSKEYLYHQCHTKCSEAGDDSVRACCQSYGFATGYCTSYGAARCNGRNYEVGRLDGARVNGRGYGGVRVRNEAQTAQYVDAAYQRAKEVVRAYESAGSTTGAGAEVPVGDVVNGQTAAGRRRRSFP